MPPIYRSWGLPSLEQRSLLCSHLALKTARFISGVAPKLSHWVYTGLHVLGWAHTCNVTAYRNTVSWQCWRDTWPRNVSKVGYAVTLRACSVRCRYLAVTSKGWYGYGLSRSGRATWHVTTATLFSVSLNRNVYKRTKPLLAAKTSLGLP